MFSIFVCETDGEREFELCRCGTNPEIIAEALRQKTRDGWFNDPMPIYSKVRIQRLWERSPRNGGGKKPIRTTTNVVVPFRPRQQ
jgi:hypothetical protein